ncbi:MAG: hypothetical protein CYPHOPRED_003999 [Cyphobasidiales sp. Tagirdzhanova-0007]|nr:MAG: hypothetical protein CYPHOPRED_003999 [Cyphobasidiales sp. Tagirdzhanova-0007]
MASSQAGDARKRSLDWDDEEDEDGTTSDVEKQQLLITRLLDTAKKNGRQIASKLEVQVDGVFNTVEKNMGDLQATVEKAVDERSKHLTAMIEQARILEKKHSDLQIKHMEKQLAQLRQLSTVYDDEVQGPQATQNPSRGHLHRRQLHADKTSKKGAHEAQRVQKHNNREQLIMVEAKAFEKAHRDLFRSLHTANTIPI